MYPYIPVSSKCPDVVVKKVSYTSEHNDVISSCTRKLTGREEDRKKFVSRQNSMKSKLTSSEYDNVLSRDLDINLRILYQVSTF